MSGRHDEFLRRWERWWLTDGSCWEGFVETGVMTDAGKVIGAEMVGEKSDDEGFLLRVVQGC